MTVVGIDIGGSGVRAARVEGASPEGPIAREELAERTLPEVAAAVERAVFRVSRGGEGGRVERVGVGVPGFVREGVVIASPNFPTWQDLPLAEELSVRLGLTVVVENDANAATLGTAAHLGVTSDLVMLTLGTGVGGGVISEGRLLRGRAGTAAELGHTFVGGDRACNCGGVGCLEQWCSTTGLLRSAREAGREDCRDGQAVVDAARAGEAWAQAIVAEAGRRLGIGLTNLVNVFAPEVVALAGGLSLAQDLLEGPATQWLQRYGIPANAGRVSLRWLGPADALAIVGAAVSAREAPAP